MAEMNFMYLENLEEYLCDENRIVSTYIKVYNLFKVKSPARGSMILVFSLAYFQQGFCIPLSTLLLFSFSFLPSFRQY